MKTTDIQNVLWNLFWLCLMELLWTVNEIFVTVQLLPNSSFRSRNTTQAGKRKDPGFHPISESSRQESGVLWWSLHSEAGLWFWWNYRIKWQLQGLAKWEARVEEVHRGASPNVLICQWQVRNHNAFLCGPNDGKMHSKTPSVCEYSHRWALLKKENVSSSTTQMICISKLVSNCFSVVYLVINLWNRVFMMKFIKLTFSNDIFWIGSCHLMIHWEDMVQA